MHSAEISRRAKTKDDAVVSTATNNHRASSFFFEAEYTEHRAREAAWLASQEMREKEERAARRAAAVAVLQVTRLIVTRRLLWRAIWSLEGRSTLELRRLVARRKRARALAPSLARPTSPSTLNTNR